MILNIAPDRPTGPRPWVFLAGTIDQGNSRDWQTEMQELLQQQTGTLLSPRRVNWDASWPNDPQFAPFAEQVHWEQEYLQEADIVFLHFESGSQSPITLLELGQMLEARRPLIVHCPTDFWRYGNVQLTCDRYQIPVYTDYQQAVSALRAVLVR